MATQIKMCVASVLRVTAVWKKDQSGWTLWLTCDLCPGCVNRLGWTWFIQEMQEGTERTFHQKTAKDTGVHQCCSFRYLCEFAYYCSLYHGQRKAALIHVPSCGTLQSTDALVQQLQGVIQAMLQQVEDSAVAEVKSQGNETV